MADRNSETCDVHQPVRLSAGSGAMIVMASMVGVGVFTLAGEQAAQLASPAVILTAWGVGGLIALCGALCYAELGAALPHNGGEYALLSRIFHPAVGFVAGWNSLIVGFAAPLAAMGLTFGGYLAVLLPGLSPPVAATALILWCAVMHTVRVSAGLGFQNAITALKLLLMLGFIVAGFACCSGGMWRQGDGGPWSEGVGSLPFAMSLYAVSYAYTGWNAANYLAGEMRDPARSLPRAVVAGTSLVTLLYLLLNALFLAATPRQVLADAKERVAFVAAAQLFGEGAAQGMALLLAIGLVATVSAMTFAGPRVYEAAGRDYRRINWLAIRRLEGGPIFAIALQTVPALAMVWMFQVLTLLEYVGFTLSLFTALTAIGVIVLRIREPDLPRPYRLWGYPGPVVVIVGLQLWMLVQEVRGKPEIVLAGVATLAVGGILYLLVRESPGSSPQP